MAQTTASFGKWRYQHQNGGWFSETENSVTLNTSSGGNLAGKGFYSVINIFWDNMTEIGKYNTLAVKFGLRKYDSDSVSATAYLSTQVHGTAFDSSKVIANSVKEINFIDYSTQLVEFIFDISSLQVGAQNLYIWLDGKDQIYTVTPNSTSSALWENYLDYNLKIYPIKYNANGGSGAPDTDYKTHGVIYQISSIEPTKKDEIQTVTGSSDITLYSNGGYFNTTTTTAKQVNVPTQRSDTVQYSFQEWNTNSIGSGTSYKPGANYSINAELLLYAQYNSQIFKGTTLYYIAEITKPIRDSIYPISYKVNYNTNGGNVLPQSAAKVARIYSFRGWASNEENANNGIANVNGNYTSAPKLWACWSYTDHDATITLPTPVRAGFEFLGWAEEPGQSSNLLAAGTQAIIKSDTTYYAVWKPNGTVRIFANGEYKIATVYMHDGNSWKLVIPYLHNGSFWKICGG